jgi:mRNA interferase RelE/StbE
MRELDLYKNPQKVLEKLSVSDKKICSAILKKIENLLVNPLPDSSRKLTGFKDLHRIRIDKYRLIYKFDDKILSILHIAKRDDVYDFLRRLK